MLLSGSWNLNPWFVQVEQVPMVEIPIGYVGVVISFVGKAHEDVSGVDFKHGDLVNAGHKGVWVTPLYPGKHPLNTRVMKVELVPTTNIVLNWASRTEAHDYDAKLSSITVRSQDGFAFNLDVSQIIHVGALDAPKVISRVGSMQNLVDHVPAADRRQLLPQRRAGLHRARLPERAQPAPDGGRRSTSATAIGAYDVQAIDTLIGDINPPAQLMQTQTDRKIAEEQQKTLRGAGGGAEAAPATRAADGRWRTSSSRWSGPSRACASRSCRRARRSSAGRRAESSPRATGESRVRLRGVGEAEAIRATGTAKAEAYRAGVEALGAQGYTMMQLMQIVGDRNVRIVPDVSVSGETGGEGLVAALLGSLMKDRKNGGVPCRLLK